MRIAVGIFGIPRGAAIAHPAIERCLLAPLRGLGELSLLGHLFHQGRVDNLRSGESGALSPSDYALFASSFKLALEAPQDCLAQWPYAELQGYGDSFGDQFRSMSNLVHQLHSLFQVTQMIKAVDPDVVVFARPDLLYHQEIPASAIRATARHDDRCYVPDWQWWGGYNDRFAICGRQAYLAYGERIRQARSYCELPATPRPLHSERLVQHALREARVAVRTLSLRASRVRVDGRIEDEDFDPRRTLGLPSWRRRSELRLRQAITRLRF